MPAPKFLKSFRADSLLFGDGFREGDPEGGDSMSGNCVDGCVGAREPDSMGIQIASVTVSGAPDRGWFPIDLDCRTPTSDGLGELPECRGDFVAEAWLSVAKQSPARGALNRENIKPLR